MKKQEAVKNVLSGKWLPFIVVCIALFLTLSSLSTDLQFDDYSHLGKMRYPTFFPEHKSNIMGLFTFAYGDSGVVERDLLNGHYPWWTQPDLKINFFRPLAVATHWLDHHYLTNKPVLMHLHSLLWFGAMVFMAALLYRRLLTPLWIAGLAALLFAIDDAHGVPAAWLANRNGLLAAVFGFLTTYLHDRWRKDGWTAGAMLAPVSFLCSLFSAEAGVATGAYIFSYELFLGSGHWRKKIMSILPYILLGAAWIALYRTLGFGTYGSGVYIDPAKEPLTYLFALFERIPVFLNGQWLLPPAQFYDLIPKPAGTIVLTILYILMALTAVMFFPLLKRDAVARFWTLGMMLSLLPISAGMPHNRNLIFVGLGAMGLLAQFLGSWWQKADWLPVARWWRLPARGIVFVFVVAHLILAPLTLPSECLSMKQFNEMIFEKPLLQLAEHTSFTDKILIFINPPVSFPPLFLTPLCMKHRIAPPLKARPLLSGVNTKVAITRIDENTLAIEPENGFIDTNFDRLFRSANHPMNVGEIVKMGDVQAEVLSLTKDKRPLKVKFAFFRSLDHASLLFFKWQNDGFAPFDLPKIGESVILPKITLKLF